LLGLLVSQEDVGGYLVPDVVSLGRFHDVFQLCVIYFTAFGSFFNRAQARVRLYASLEVNNDLAFHPFCEQPL
jgi:hypothetical protein